MNARSVIVAGITLAMGAAGARAQKPDRCRVAKPDAVVVYGEGVKTVSFGLAELKGMPSSVVRALGHDGKEASFRGVSLGALLERAGGPPGGQIRGAALRQYLVAEAADGYHAVIAYAEADSSYRAEPIVVAYEEDGKALDRETGPLQLVIPADRRHGRWVRQLECVRVAREAGR
jgi:hypothetical protein